MRAVTAMGRFPTFQMVTAFARGNSQRCVNPVSLTPPPCRPRRRARGRSRRRTIVPPHEGVPAELAPHFQPILETVRQRYLDALPIAAAIVTISDDSFIDCANDQFRFLAEWDERLGERRIAQVPLLRSGPIGTRLTRLPQEGRSRLPVRHRRRPQHRRPPFHRPLRPPLGPPGPAAALPDLADRQDRAGRDRAQPALGNAARHADRPAQPLRLQREGRGGARRSQPSPRTAMRCSRST